MNMKRRAHPIHNGWSLFSFFNASPSSCLIWMAERRFESNVFATATIHSWASQFLTRLCLGTRKPMWKDKWVCKSTAVWLHLPEFPDLRTFMHQANDMRLGVSASLIPRRSWAFCFVPCDSVDRDLQTLTEKQPWPGILFWVGGGTADHHYRVEAEEMPLEVKETIWDS